MKNVLLLLLCLMLFKTHAAAQNHKQRTPAETVRAFAKWYGANWEKVDAWEAGTLHMGLLELKVGEENPPYSINFNGVEEYITGLSATGFFSEQYLVTQRQAFKDADKNFKQNPQNDGPPEGFQADRFFLTQEDFLQDIKNIDKIEIKEKLLQNNTADVYMYFPHCNMTYHYRLSGAKGKWQIDSIENSPFYYSLPKHR